MKQTWKAAIVIFLSTAFGVTVPTLAAQYVPNWAKVFSTREFEGYIDLTSKRYGPVQEDRPVTVEMIALVSFKNPLTGAAKPIWSLTERLRFDCVRHQTVGIYTSYYDSRMGAGLELATKTDKYDWTTPNPGTFTEALWNAVCGASRTPGETDEQVVQATTRNNADIGNSCGEPEVSNPAIIAYLNAKVGEFGAPSRRVTAIRGAAPQPGEMSDRHTRCHGILVFSGGRTEVGILLEDQVNGVRYWRWHSDQELAQGPNSPAQKKLAAQVDDEMRKSANARPNETTRCSVEGPQPVYTTQAVCYAVIKLLKNNQDKLKPYAGYALLQNCGHISSKVCRGIVSEMQLLASVAHRKSRFDLTETCANDLEKRFPGDEQAQYMNLCQDLVDYFK